MQVFEKRLSEIHPYEKNPRKNDAAVEYVAKSIREFGFKVPIVIDAAGEIVCGHTRYKAAQQIGLETVPCVVADDLTPEQVKAFRIADNKVSDYSIWDNKLLLEELQSIDESCFTGFEASDIFNNVLDESDKSTIDENQAGVMYEIVLRSENKSKVEQIKKIWEEMNGEDSGGGNLRKETGGG